MHLTYILSFLALTFFRTFFLSPPIILAPCSINNPVYGPDGKRQNTRAVRWKERYTAQRQGVLEQLLQLSSSNGNSKQLASLFRPTKKVQKITIPVDKHPNYNFIGLIIGPRGKTQKELEAKTGCKIAIRGKGSVKEGARGRRDGQADPGDYEPLHVVVTGDDPRAVDAAATMIQEMLVVLDDERNVHKQQQLRELALLNGTLKDDETIYCPVCAEKGHRAFECPQRLAQQQKNRTAAVQCAICGETSHPTRDCKQQPNNNVGGVQQPPSKTPATSSREMDSDYQSFLAELEGGKPKQQQPPTNSSIPQQPHKDSSLPLPPAAPLPVVAPPPPILGGGLLPPPAAATLGLPPPPVAVGLPPPPVPGMENPAFHDRTYYSPANANAYPMQSTAPQLYPPAHHHHQPPHAHHQPQYQHHYPEAASNNYPPPHQSYNNAQYPPPQLSPQEQQQQQQPQYQQVQPGQETATWDPNAYYGSGGGGGGNGGGLNWWEQ